MKKILFITFLLIIPLTISAQIGSHFGGIGNQYGYRIKPTQGGGFIVGGSTDSKIDGEQDYWVIRFDKNGKPMWDSGYGNGPTNFLWSVEPTSDNGALLAGYNGVQNSGTEEALMYKIDSVGKIVKKVEVNYASSDHAHWFKELNDGHYYWAGHTDSEGDPNGDMIMQKLDSNFNKIWEKTYDNGSAEHCHTAAVTADNGCILLGHTTISNHEKFFAVRVDTAGTVIWKKTYSSNPANNDSPYDVEVTREGNYAFFGYSGDYSTVSAFWLLVVDTSGNVVIDKHFNSDVSFVYGGIQSSDSGFVLAGYSQKANQATQMYVVKTDKKGNLEWQKTFGDSAAGYDVMQHGKQFIVAGETYQTEDHLDDLWLVVLDSAGNAVPLDTASAIDTAIKTIAISGLKLNGNAHLKQIGNDMPMTISWIETGDLKTSADVSFSLDGGVNWSKIQTVASGVNQITWANTPKTGYYPSCLVRVVSTLKPSVFVQSDTFIVGTTGRVSESLSSVDFNLSNHPNPFSTTTIISFSLTKTEHLKLEIFNTLGEKILALMDRTEEVGSHYLKFNAKDLPAGTYFYRLTSSQGSETKQMIIAK